MTLQPVMAPQPALQPPAAPQPPQMTLQPPSGAPPGTANTQAAAPPGDPAAQAAAQQQAAYQFYAGLQAASSTPIAPGQMTDDQFMAWYDAQAAATPANHQVADFAGHT